MSNIVKDSSIKYGFFHMPKPFYAIFLVEFWERFAFYGLQSVAVLFFIKKIHLNDNDASTLFASFSAILYAMLIIGGFLGDKILGLRRTYFLGIIFLMIGYGMFGFITSISMVYFAMGIILVGNILFKTNAGNFVNRCFEENDPRLDSAFTYFYMSINLGSFFSQTIVPFVAEKTSFSVGISICGLGLFIALISFLFLKKYFVLIDNEVGKNKTNSLTQMSIISILGIIGAYALGILLSYPALTNIVLISSIAIFGIILCIVRKNLTLSEKKGMDLVIFMLTQAVVFFIIYIQVGTSLTLFAEHNVTNVIFGIKIPAGVTQSFNPLYIFILSPILANLYIRSEQKNKPISIPTKFACGIFCCALAYLLLCISCSLAGPNGRVSMIWLFLGYGLYSLGELLVSAIGLSMVAKLLPKRLGGFAQASWFITSAIGFKIGGIMAASVSHEDVANSLSNKIVLLHSYQHLFAKIGFSTLVFGIIFFITAKNVTNKINQFLN